MIFKNKKIERNVILSKQSQEGILSYCKMNHPNEMVLILKGRHKKGKIFDNLKEAYSHLGKIIRNDDLLMIKGSNATGLNRFSRNIKRGQISAI